MTTALNRRCSFFPFIFKLAYTYCYGLIGNTFENFVKFLEIYVSKKATHSQCDRKLKNRLITSVTCLIFIFENSINIKDS